MQEQERALRYMLRLGLVMTLIVSLIQDSTTIQVVVIRKL